ncbi:MAG: hypothetical protein WDN04_20220 [Rhodospirillales bacterium]
MLMTAEGGVDIEDEARRAQLFSAAADPDLDSVMRNGPRPCVPPSAEIRAAVAGAGQALAQAFFHYEAVLLEINPLFICADGNWVVGDAKFVADGQCVRASGGCAWAGRSAPDAVPANGIEANQGYDFVRLDPLGDIGLVTTGAGSACSSSMNW